MAFPTAINSQVTDSVTQANTKVLGDAPALALSNFYITASQALGNAAHNATTQQQQANAVSQAALTMSVETLYAIDTAATGVATSKIFQTSSAKMAASKPVEVTADQVVGHIHTLLGSPQGRSQMQQAITQASESKLTADSEAQMATTQQEIEKAIQEALDAGLSKQAVCYQLHQVAHDNNVSLVYPAADAPDLSIEKIEAYYNAIIAAHHAESR
jgi:hypothetical protein